MENKRQIFDPKTVCRVIIKDGYHSVVMPDGETIPRQVWSRVYSGSANKECGPDYAIVKIFVNIDNE